MSIIVSQVDHQFKPKRIIKPREIEYSVRTVSEIADDIGASDAVACLVNSTMVTRSRPKTISSTVRKMLIGDVRSWDDIPANHSSLVFINTPTGDVLSIGGSILEIKNVLGLLKKAKKALTNLFRPKIPSLSNLT